MIRIMHICSDSIVGGACVTLLRIIKNADKKAFRHIVVLPEANPLYSEFAQLDIDLLPLKAPHDRSFTLRGVHFCLKAIRKYHPDIIHTHGAVFGRIAGYIGGVRSLVYTRHTYADKKVSFLARSINKRTASVAVAVSPAVVTQITASGIPESRIRIIENGCDDMSCEGAHVHSVDSKCRLLYLGRLTEEKGIKLALEAFSILKRESNEYSLYFVGDGEMKEYIDSYIADNGLSDSVSCSSFRSDIKNVLSECDVLLNCSYKNEAASVAIMEAFSAAIPVCASNIGGNAHIVTQGVDGILYESGNANALAEAIHTAVAQYTELSVNAKETYARRFQVSRMVLGYESLWKEEYERIKS